MTAAIHPRATSADELHRSFYPLTYVKGIKLNQTIPNIDWTDIVWLSAPFSTIQGIGWKQNSTTEFECLVSGFYIVHIKLAWDDPPAAGSRGHSIDVNGTRRTKLNWTESPAGISGVGNDHKNSIHPSTFIRGDILKTQAYQNSGGDLSVRSSDSMLQIFSVAYDPSRF